MKMGSTERNMKTKPNLESLMLFVALVAFSGGSFAQNVSPDELNKRTIERRAVEAVIWGMPAVNYDLMLQETLNNAKGDVNQIVYWSRLPTWKNQTLTPNPDAVYMMAFFNEAIA